MGSASTGCIALRLKLAGWLSLLHSGDAISPVESPAVGETVFLQLLFFRLTLHPILASYFLSLGDQSPILHFLCQNALSSS